MGRQKQIEMKNLDNTPLGIALAEVCEIEDQIESIKEEKIDALSAQLEKAKQKVMKEMESIGKQSLFFKSRVMTIKTKAAVKKLEVKKQK